MNSYLRNRNDFNLFNEDFLHDVFGFSKSRNLYNIMKTDIEEKKEGFVITVEMPGYDKEELKVQIEKGYLTIEASKKNENREKEEKKYLIRERQYGKISRTYYLGDDIKEDNIQANFINGVLTLNVPKIDKTKEEIKKYITIL